MFCFFSFCKCVILKTVFVGILQILLCSSVQVQKPNLSCRKYVLEHKNEGALIYMQWSVRTPIRKPAEYSNHDS